MRPRIIRIMAACIPPLSATVLPPMEPVPPCPTCHKPEALCVCAAIKPIPTRTRVLILQHPQEPDVELGSARIAHLCLPHSTLRIGLSWPNLGAALGDGEPPNNKQWLVLYLGSTRPPRREPGAASPLVVVDRRGAPIEPHARPA